MTSIEALATNDKLAIHDPAAEIGVIGSALIDPKAIEIIKNSKVRPDDFYKDSHKLIYAAILDLAQRGIPADYIIIGNELERRGQIVTIGDMDYLSSAVNAVPTSEHIDYYLGIVKEHATTRQGAQRLFDAGSKLVIAAQKGDRAAITKAQEALDAAKHDASQGKPNRFRSAHMSELRQRPGFEWLISKVIMANTTGGIFGESESGKSLVALHMAIHIAMGWNWDGAPTKQGHVVYIAAEGAVGVRYRLDALCMEYGISFDAIDPFIHVIGEAVPLLKPDCVTELMEEIARIRDEECTSFSPLRIVFFDTLTRCMEGGDENNNDDMRDALAATDRVHREFSIAAFNIHHAGKNGAYRGASNYKACLETMIEVTQQQTGIVKVRCEKQKDGAQKFSEKIFYIKSVAFDDDAEITAPILISSIVTPPTPPDDLKLNASKKQALLALKNMFLTYAEWERSANLTEGAWKYTHKKLVEDGLVIHEGDKYSLSHKAQAWYQKQATKETSFVWDDSQLSVESSPIIPREGWDDMSNKDISSLPMIPPQRDEEEVYPRMSAQRVMVSTNAVHWETSNDDLEAFCGCGHEAEGYTPKGKPYCEQCRATITA